MGVCGIGMMDEPERYGVLGDLRMIAKLELCYLLLMSQLDAGFSFTESYPHFPCFE